MSETVEIYSASLNTQPANGNTPDISVSAFAVVGIIANQAVLTGGTTPAVQFEVQVRNAIGIYVKVANLSSVLDSGLAASVDSLGVGGSINELPGKTIRLKWTTTGAPTTSTTQVVLYGRVD